MLIRISIFFFFICGPGASQQIEWENTNGPAEVTITCIISHPDGYLFAGTAQNYLYRSSNEGENWENITNGFLSSHLSDIVIRWDGDIFISGYGIYLSTDSGNSWTMMGPTEYLRCIVTNSLGDIFAGGWGKIYRSTNNGVTWVEFSQGLPVAWIDEILVDSNDNLIVGTTFGIYRSVDSGSSWMHIGKPEWMMNGFYFEGLAMNPSGWLFTLDGYEGIYYSTNGGATWINAYPGVSNLTALGLDQTDNRILVGSIDGFVYQSVDLGSTWIRINEGYNFSAVNVFNLEYNNRIIVGSEYAGIFSTTDYGFNWLQNNAGFKHATVFDLESNSLGDIFARTRTFIYRSTDNGTQWIPTNFGDDAEADIFINSYDHIFASTSFLPGARSTDFGQTWVTISYGICCHIASWGEDINQNLFAAASGFYKSTDNGDSWTLISSPYGLQTFKFNRHNLAFGGTIFGTILRSTDGGFSWDSVGTSGSWKTLGSTLITKNETVFMASNDRGGVHRSTDNGNTWAHLTNGINDSSILSITEDLNGFIYIATNSSGILKSINNGDEWTPINYGLPDTSILALTANREGYLFAGCDGNGIYRTVTPTTSIIGRSESPQYFLLEQNFPNPFNPITKIKYSVLQLSNVLIKVFDILGNQIETLVNEVKPAGTYELTWDAVKLPSGIYFYQLKTGSYIETKKMILLK